MRVAEEDIDIGRQSELAMSGHLSASIPCQRSVEFLWQLARLFDQRLNDAVAVFVTDLGQHNKTGLPFDQCRDEAIA